MIVPTVFVNNVAERGGISTTAVLSTICAGYADKTEPDVRNCFFVNGTRFFHIFSIDLARIAGIVMCGILRSLACYLVYTYLPRFYPPPSFGRLYRKRCSSALVAVLEAQGE